MGSWPAITMHAEVSRDGTIDNLNAALPYSLCLPHSYFGFFCLFCFYSIVNCPDLKPSQPSSKYHIERGWRDHHKAAAAANR